jgi:phosphocarrier protein HPr
MLSSHTDIIKEINQTANRFQSSIVLVSDNKALDAKSLLGLFLSYLSMTKEYIIEIYGPDEEEAKKAMLEVFQKHEIKATVK